MTRLRRFKLVAIGLLAWLAKGPATLVSAVTPEEINQKLKALEDEVRSLRQQLEAVKTNAAPAPAPAPAPVPAGAPASASPDSPPRAAQPTPQGSALAPTASNKDLFG